jgi:hypothetical protein
MTKFWIKNYFHRRNYLKVDGKPVIVMFAPSNPVNDMGLEQSRATFEKMRAMCREAGFEAFILSHDRRKRRRTRTH